MFGGCEAHQRSKVWRRQYLRRILVNIQCRLGWTHRHNSLIRGGYRTRAAASDKTHIRARRCVQPARLSSTLRRARSRPCTPRVVRDGARGREQLCALASVKGRDHVDRCSSCQQLFVSPRVGSPLRRWLRNRRARSSPMPGAGRHCAHRSRLVRTIPELNVQSRALPPRFPRGDPGHSKHTSTRHGLAVACIRPDDTARGGGAQHVRARCSPLGRCDSVLRSPSLCPFLLHLEKNARSSAHGASSLGAPLCKRGGSAPCQGCLTRRKCSRWRIRVHSLDQ